MISKSALVALYTAAVAADDNFIAINDLVPAGTEPPDAGKCTWTRLTHGRNLNSGDGELASANAQGLVDTNGRKLDAKLQLVEKASHNTLTINNAKNTISVKKGSPAWEEYGSCLCDADRCDEATGECECDALNGSLSYNDAPGWELRYVFSGLNPKCEAEVSFFVERGSQGHGNAEDYASRYTIFTLEKAKSAMAQETLALKSLNAGSTLALRSGENAQGHIAKWTRVTHDGSFEVVATHGSQALADAGVSPPPHPFKGYAGGVLKLRQICAEAPVVATAAKADGEQAVAADAPSGNTGVVIGVAAVAAAALAAFGVAALALRRRGAKRNIAAEDAKPEVNPAAVAVKHDLEAGDSDNKSNGSTKTPTSEESSNGENPDAPRENSNTPSAENPVATPFGEKTGISL